MKIGLVFMSMMVMLTIAGDSGVIVAQNRPADATEVAFRVLSAQARTFDKPIRIGPPKRAIEYREAVVLTLEVDREAFDALSPSMEAFLYIGRNEYRIFNIDRRDDRNTLLLTFHIRNWPQLRENSPMVLTIEHGAPIRNPERFERRQGPRLNKRILGSSPN
ncbi:MAG TPA: hypothetical protein VF290_17810 [Pyrinomonadaceae bacterium]